MRGSDHAPLRLALALSPPPPPARPPPDQPTYRIIIPTDDTTVRAKYLDLITRAATWTEYNALVADPTSTRDAVLAALIDLIFNTAVAAGYGVRVLRTGASPAAARPMHRTSSNYKTWHDNECKRLQQAMRAIPRHTADPTAAQQRAELERQYKHRVTRLVRQHKIAHARQQLRMWRSNTTSFWRSYRHRLGACPLAPAAAAAHFKTR